VSRARPRLLLAAALLVGALGCSSDEQAAAESCDFTVSKNELSAKIPTVGVVEWSLAGAAPSSAKVVYRLDGATAGLLNLGGEAPVDLTKTNHRTLLLGLKQGRDYTFHVEATRNGRTCISADHALPTTGVFATQRSVALSVVQPEKREPGFIVTSSGTTVPSSAFILDADAEIVWDFEGPQNLTRAHMDYEGETMWMLELNLTNEGGEMRSVSMDGEREQRDVPGLAHAHHDFTVMPGGSVAAIAWSGSGIDPESELVVRAPDGSVRVPFRIGANLYRSDAYHANAVHYVPFDDSFTLADRNPNLLVKVSAAGSLRWQLGGSCDAAPAGDRCMPVAWEVVHGHHSLEDGTFVVFNNTYGDVSRVYEFDLNETPTSFSASVVENYAGTALSNNIGDVQRLPGGNTLVTYASDGKIVELDASWNEVQTLTLRTGYTNWRPTLYGPPPRP